MALEHFTVNTSENSKNLTAVLDGKQVTIASVDKLANTIDRVLSVWYHQKCSKY
jgi:hypothetical protein